MPQLQVDELRALVDDRAEAGVFRVHKDLFRNEDIFALEMQRIFEATWIFVCLASQVPKPHDYLTVQLGRHPVVVMRDGDGKLGCFVNSCRHRGAKVCQLTKGNKRRHTCPYHGWTYDSSGKLWSLRDKEAGGYSPAFDSEDHDLARVARFEEYRGFLFASFNPGVVPLREHLGGARALIDLICDQSPAGEVELVPGSNRYLFDGNWKFQLENGTDGYHFVTAHASLLKVVERRKKAALAGAEGGQVVKNIFGDEKPVWETDKTTGTMTFESGIVAIWAPIPASSAFPLWESREELAKRVDPARLQWMFDNRLISIFPNLQLSSSFGTQLRVIRPISSSSTEMVSYCIAPVGESATARALRIRQFEDFYNASGLAAPDDNTIFEQCQTGAGSDVANWYQGYMRGMMKQRPEANRTRKELGVETLNHTESGFALQDETVFHGIYREWVRLMTREAAPVSRE